MDYTVSNKTNGRNTRLTTYSILLNLIICNGILSKYQKFVQNSIMIIAQWTLGIIVILAYLNL